MIEVIRVKEEKTMEKLYIVYFCIYIRNIDFCIYCLKKKID